MSVLRHKQHLIGGLEIKNLHRYSAAVGIDKKSKLRADIEKQNHGVFPELYYYSMQLTCEKCQERFWFSAQEQKVWYEKFGFYIDSVPKQCKDCRNNNSRKR